MPKRMLIDASHPEETRVVVLDGQKVEEFDFESASKRPLKGNIYLAKVTRVEPSLQAAFVEYGGNRQGFLAFSEIHPDYYKIPVADRQALLAEAQAEARRNQEDDFESFDIKGSGKRKSAKNAKADPDGESDEETADETEPDENAADEAPNETAQSEDEAGPEVAGDSTVEFGIASNGKTADETAAETSDDAKTDTAEPAENVSETAEASADNQPLQAKRPSQRWMKKRHYKIQEVIKRGQIILVQVVKEERGNKGAALTTYLSLAGRYCVLMPNTPRGGGISRKITNAADRKRLKTAAQSLDLPEGMGLIIRTAGGNRTKLEIKRDYEYLLRMWDTIREMTLKSVAPSCVYEEGDLVKRAIRDLYNKDVEEVLVEGEAGYRSAKDFMRMLMPSHAKNVKLYKEPVPLYQRFHIEAQLDAMFSPIVTLKSGGYIVIDQTEALVAIDVNSGRATKEHSIEETATKTNLEAADEVGRQLRLRDLAGLVVVDFIDMEESRNDRLVEKRMMSAVKNDRARIQVGKISQFGLLELSRQRLRAGVVAGSTIPCPHCGGTGLVRSVESTALRVLRGIEEEAQKQNAEALAVHVAGDVALYILNQKRAELAQVEKDYEIVITFTPKEDLKAGDYTIDRIGQRDPARVKAVVTVDTVALPEPEEEPDEEEPAEEAPTEEAPAPAGEQNQPGEGGGRRRRRRRRGRGGDRDRGEHGERNEEGRDAPAEAAAEGETAAVVEPAEGLPADGQPAQNGEAGEGGGRRRRRRRRGRRGGRERNQNPETETQTAPEAEAADGTGESSPGGVAIPITIYEDRFGRVEDIDTTPQEEPRLAAPAEPVEEVASEAPLVPAEEPAAPQAPAQAEPARVEVAPSPAPAVEIPPAPAVTERKPKEPPKPVKKGWWQRTFRVE